MNVVKVLVERKAHEFDTEPRGYITEVYQDATYEIDSRRESLDIMRDGKEIAHYPRGKFERVHLTEE